MLRRGFLCACAAAAVPALAAAAPIDPHFWGRPRSVWLIRAQTGEQLREIYFAQGALVWEGYARCCWLLRDLHSGASVQMDLPLLDAICGAQGYLAAFGVHLPWVVTSGFRSAATNAKTEGAALQSQHLYGKATDGYFPGLSVRHQSEIAALYSRGGLGFYPQRGFLHLDTGRLRLWRG